MSGAVRHFFEGFKLRQAPRHDSPATAVPASDDADKIGPNNTYEKTSYEESDPAVEDQVDGEKVASSSFQENGEITGDDPGLKRKLSQFHIQMIAFGGRYVSTSLHALFDGVHRPSLFDGNPGWGNNFFVHAFLMAALVGW